MSLEETEKLEQNGRTSIKDQTNLQSNSQTINEDGDRIPYKKEKVIEEQVIPDSENETLVYEPIEGTPFVVVELDGKWVIVWLNYWMIQPRNTKKEALKCLKTEAWEMQSMLTLAILEEKKKQEAKEKS